MSYNYDYSRLDQVQKYKGIPNNQDPKENSLWKKFIKALLPFIARKWELGNAYLEAKVAKEVNEAEKIKAETTLLMIQAEKEIRDIMEINAKEDEGNAQKIDGQEIFTREELDIEMEELKAKIQMAHLKYGLKVSVTVEEENKSPLTKELMTDDLPVIRQDLPEEK